MKSLSETENNQHKETRKKESYIIDEAIQTSLPPRTIKKKLFRQHSQLILEKQISHDKHAVYVNGIKYNLSKKPLGVGGKSIVYLATNSKSGEIYAAKIYNTHSLYEKEIQTLNSLGEFHAQTIYTDPTKENCSENICILKKYFPGDTLTNYIYNIQEFNDENKCKTNNLIFTKKQNDPIQLAEISLLTIKSVLDLHLKKVYHKDIKSENFILNVTKKNKITVHIIDHDSAVYFNDSLVNLIERAGTYGYYAPELSTYTSKNRPPYSTQTEMYCLGVLLCELITNFNYQEYLINQLEILEKSGFIEDVSHKQITSCFDSIFSKSQHNTISTELQILIPFIQSIMQENPNKRPDLYESIKKYNNLLEYYKEYYNLNLHIIKVNIHRIKKTLSTTMNNHQRPVTNPEYPEYKEILDDVKNLRADLKSSLSENQPIPFTQSLDRNSFPFLFKSYINQPTFDTNPNNTNVTNFCIKNQGDFLFAQKQAEQIIRHSTVIIEKDIIKYLKENPDQAQSPEIQSLIETIGLNQSKIIAKSQIKVNIL